MIALIAAVARNGVIGRDGRIPWDIPEDRTHFKELTMGHVLVMGRRTYEEIGRPLPGRVTIVVSKKLAAERKAGVQALKADDAFAANGLLVTASFDDALRLAREVAPEKTVFVSGGGLLYAEAVAKADVLYLTEIDADIAGDTFFPLSEAKNPALFESEITGGGAVACGETACTWQADGGETACSGQSDGSHTADVISYRYVTYRRRRN